jgi:hypothetical protein
MGEWRALRKSVYHGLRQFPTEKGPNMNTREAIKASIDMAKMISMSYIGDLSDGDLMKRPCKGCNHINWQLGHLIASEHKMIDSCLPGSMPALPAGFTDKYSKEAAESDDTSHFHSKDELIGVFQEQRAATLAALDKCSDKDLDNPSPENMQAYAPNWGSAFAMQGSHWLMHVGQWAVVRRQLGHPPLF